MTDRGDLFRDAVTASLDPVGRRAAELSALADELERNASVRRLLAHELAGGGDPGTTEGRARFLARAIERRPGLMAALAEDADGLMAALAEDADGAVASEWRTTIADHSSDVAFLHGLAVLRRERVLAAMAADAPPSEDWIVATALWAALLGSEPFWTHFSAAREFADAGDDRRSLAPERERQLFDQAIRTLLRPHRTFGARDFAAGRVAHAQMHLRCLDLCGHGFTAVVDELKCHGVRVHLRRDRDRSERSGAVARELLDEWTADLVRDATRAAEDPAEIERMPQGIRKGYQAGIRRLDPFVELGVPNARIHRQLLEWFNDWCYDLYTKGEIDQIKGVLAPARGVADRLAQICVKARGHMQENQALSQHYLLRGFTEEDGAAKQRDFREALAWNPANENAKQLLDQSIDQILDEELNAAVELAQNERFTEAYQVLDSVAEQSGDTGRVAQARAAVLIHHASALHQEGQLKAALRRARRALRLVPEYAEAPGVGEFVAQLERDAPEEANIGHLRRAQEMLEAERFDDAIKRASLIPRRSRYLADGRYLRAGAQFQRALKTMAAERFGDAIDDLAGAAELLDEDEERGIVLSTLSVAYFKRAEQALNEKRFADAVPDLEQAYVHNQDAGVDGVIRSALSAALTWRADEHIGANRFGRAVADLERALEFASDPQERAVIADNLEHARLGAMAPGLGQALKAEDWPKADRVLRNALGHSELPRERRRVLQSQRSQVLTAWAVRDVNAIQQEEAEVGEALGRRDFATASALMLGGMYGGEHKPFHPGPEALQGLLERFVDRITNAKSEALGRLEEAVRLDKGNKAARESRDVVKKMLREAKRARP